MEEYLIDGVLDFLGWHEFPRLTLLSKRVRDRIAHHYVRKHITIDDSDPIPSFLKALPYGQTLLKRSIKGATYVSVTSPSLRWPVLTIVTEVLTTQPPYLTVLNLSVAALLNLPLTVTLPSLTILRLGTFLVPKTRFVVPKLRYLICPLHTDLDIVGFDPDTARLICNGGWEDRPPVSTVKDFQEEMLVKGIKLASYAVMGHIRFRSATEVIDLLSRLKQKKPDDDDCVCCVPYCLYVADIQVWHEVCEFLGRELEGGALFYDNRSVWDADSTQQLLEGVKALQSFLQQHVPPVVKWCLSQWTDVQPLFAGTDAYERLRFDLTKQLEAVPAIQCVPVLPTLESVEVEERLRRRFVKVDGSFGFPKRLNTAVTRTRRLHLRGQFARGADRCLHLDDYVADELPLSILACPELREIVLKYEDWLDLTNGLRGYRRVEPRVPVTWDREGERLRWPSHCRRIMVLYPEDDLAGCDLVKVIKRMQIQFIVLARPLWRPADILRVYITAFTVFRDYQTPVKVIPWHLAYYGSLWGRAMLEMATATYSVATLAALCAAVDDPQPCLPLQLCTADPDPHAWFLSTDDTACGKLPQRFTLNALGPQTRRHFTDLHRKISAAVPPDFPISSLPIDDFEEVGVVHVGEPWLWRSLQASQIDRLFDWVVHYDVLPALNYTQAAMINSLCV